MFIVYLLYGDVNHLDIQLAIIYSLPIITQHNLHLELVFILCIRCVCYFKSKYMSLKNFSISIESDVTNGYLKLRTTMNNYIFS